MLLLSRSPVLGEAEPESRDGQRRVLDSTEGRQAVERSQLDSSLPKRLEQITHPIHSILRNRRAADVIAGATVRANPLKCLGGQRVAVERHDSQPLQPSVLDVRDGTGIRGAEPAVTVSLRGVGAVAGEAVSEGVLLVDRPDERFGDFGAMRHQSR